MPGCFSFLLDCLRSLCGFSSKTKDDFDAVGVGGRAEQPFVTVDVISLRGKASKAGDQMGKAFASSQKAYKRNKKGDAHDLSVKGKKYQAEMKKLNAAAVASIIRNQKKGWEGGKIDLHGLYVAEAESEVEAFLKHHDKKKTGVVEIVTGAGIHSTTKDHPKIRPAIDKLLKNKRIKHEMEHGNGAFKCFLR